MMKRIAPMLAGIALLAGCSSEPITTESAARAETQTSAIRESDADVNKDLATLRQVTASFHQFDNATAAGWAAKITGCMTDPTLGGMGFHYGNPALIDGTARVDQPELLLYEPEKNGDLRLVAVEYIIPYTFHSRESAPPVLFGKEFKQNDVFQLWGLHAWVWENNPSGMFANWNPNVNCDNTTDIMAMAHN
jgi:hypothetical protein